MREVLNKCPDLGQRPGQLRDHDVLEGGAVRVWIRVDDLEHRLRERAREAEVSGTRHHGKKFWMMVSLIRALWSYVGLDCRGWRSVIEINSVGVMKLLHDASARVRQMQIMS